MGTQLVAVRAGLIAGLANLPELSAFETTYIPMKGSKARNRCFTDRGRIGLASASMRATKTFRKEDGTFDLVLFMEGVGAGADPVSLSTAIHDAGTAAEDFVATHANWNGDVLGTTGLAWLAMEGEGGFAEGWTDKGLAVSLTYPITYRARLT
jgi:hypothetical protein